MQTQMIISLELMNTVTAYLGTRPYQEVYRMIEAIQREAQNQPKVETPDGYQMDSKGD